jgi:hypothetical protein
MTGRGEGDHADDEGKASGSVRGPPLEDRQDHDNGSAVADAESAPEAAAHDVISVRTRSSVQELLVADKVAPVL